jgi:serine/threonine protein kinase
VRPGLVKELIESARATIADAEPREIGPYRIVGTLGEGGSGKVYLAEQLSPVRRRVAIKVLFGSWNDSDRQRFRHEQETIARLGHPHIAHLLTWGEMPGGQLYAVMEYVEGEPITRYCRERALPVSKRLEVFLQLCDAVQHAHGRAVVHRDLTPSNVLVAEIDGRPVVKLIDFGIAKSLEPATASCSALPLT